MKNNFNLFGIKTITINGFTLQTFRVRVKNTPFNRQLIEKEFEYDPIYSLPSADGRLIDISFTAPYHPMNSQTFKRIGVVLKQIQLNNIEEKYSWTNSFL